MKKKFNFEIIPVILKFFIAPLIMPVCAVIFWGESVWLIPVSIVALIAIYAISLLLMNR